mgnify:CR=1 FL=1
MLLRIQPDSDVPIFQQIADDVRSHLAQRRLSPGHRLPAAREVAESLGINVHTVLHAYRELRDEGLVELRRGRGAVVTEAAEQLANLTADIEALVRKSAALGLRPHTLSALVLEAANEHA